MIIIIIQHYDPDEENILCYKKLIREMNVWENVFWISTRNCN